MRARPSLHLAVAAVLALIALLVAVPVAPAAAAIPAETDTSATTIRADLAGNYVEGWGWAAGTQVTIEIWADGSAIDAMRSEHASVSSTGTFGFSFGQPWSGGFDITSGMVVSVTGTNSEGPVTKVMSDTEPADRPVGSADRPHLRERCHRTGPGLRR